VHQTVALRFVILCFFSLPAIANYGNATVSEVTSIYDADTFQANTSGWSAVIIPIRVKGADALESHSNCESKKMQARKAKRFTVAKLRAGNTIRLDELDRGTFSSF
jgi:endonuclease YncB( thermonuclease family)